VLIIIEIESFWEMKKIKNRFKKIKTYIRVGENVYRFWGEGMEELACICRS